MAGSQRRASEQAQPTAGNRLGRVLVVEDEQDVAKMIRYNIAKEVTRCGSPATGPTPSARSGKPAPT